VNALDLFLDALGWFVDILNAVAWWRFWVCIGAAAALAAAVWFLVPADNVRLPAVIAIGLTGLLSGFAWQWNSQ
jgi:hypothetical protein